jgi:hypothetical protein
VGVGLPLGDHALNEPLCCLAEEYIGDVSQRNIVVHPFVCLRVKVRKRWNLSVDDHLADIVHGQSVSETIVRCYRGC